MGRIIRRTVMITMTETWTIVWATDDTSQPQTQEEQDEAILPGVTSVAATDAQPSDVTPAPSAGVQRKRARRRVKGNE
jgi:hypothetical protein